MTKSLYMCTNPERSWEEKPKYKMITATKIDELETGVSNIYEDAEGNHYITGYSKFRRRYEFIKVDF